MGLNRYAVISAAATALALSGVAIAADPSAPHINACANRRTGALRVARRCRANERGLVWNIDGLNGARGPRGFRGPPGLPGGSAGRGVTGPRGPQGERGATGTRGVRGYRGYTGAKGVTGTPGIAGASGVTGPRGATGVTGSPGQGVTGATGSVRAYAFVNGSTAGPSPFGSGNPTFVTAQTKGFASVSEPSDGTYCLTATGIDATTTAAVVGSVYFSGEAGTPTNAQLVPADTGGDPCTPAQFWVITTALSTTGGGAVVATDTPNIPFTILVP